MKKMKRVPEIIKASGEKEKYNREKLYQSLLRIGAEKKLAENVCREVEKRIFPGINSKKIFQLTKNFLFKINPTLALKYSLKKAIFDLGPTGFPFEKYVAAMFRELGYATEIDVKVQGYCLEHEIDIVAKKENQHFLIECKYHNQGGIKTDVKVALYVFARFLDIKKSWEEKKNETSHFHQAWLVTNTKCTFEAIKYANCVGLKILAWRYPPNESLEALIEKNALYPITILFSLKNHFKKILLEKGIVLLKDFLKYSEKDLSKMIKLSPLLIRKFHQHAKALVEV